MVALVQPADEGDLSAILALLERCGLPKAGLGGHLATALVARDGGRVVGSAALELYGDATLLRSVAVEAPWRGQGLGKRLALAALDVARRRGIATVYLLTETADEFFARLGFRPIPRSEVPPAVQGSIEFTAACPVSARAMAKTLSRRRGSRR